MKETPKLYPMYKDKKEMSETPSGYVPAKFHSEFTFIPEIVKGEPMWGKSNFSESQVVFLERLERRRTLYRQEFNIQEVSILAWEED